MRRAGPFGGAGTTNLVSQQLGRKSIHVDLNPDYARMAMKRLARDRELQTAA